MTVKELIDKLQQFNGDRVVLVEDVNMENFKQLMLNLKMIDL